MIWLFVSGIFLVLFWVAVGLDRLEKRIRDLEQQDQHSSPWVRLPPG